MAYGTVKVDSITFTNGGSDQTVTVSGIVQSISGNITATGTIQGATIIGTSTVSGATVTGDAGVFTTVTGGSAGFTTVTGTTVTGTTVNFNTGTFTSQVSGATVTGNLAQFTTLTGGTAGFTTITGATVTGTTANFVTVSGTTVTGNAGQFTTITGTSAGFTTITGATVTGTVGNFGSGSAAAPSVSVGTTDNGIYSPATNQVALSTSGTPRVQFGTSEVVFNDDGNNYDFRIEGDTVSNLFFVDASADAVGIGTTNVDELLHVESDGATPKIKVESTLANSSPGFRVTNDARSYDIRIDGTNDNLQFYDATASQGRVAIDSSGRLLVGTSSAVADASSLLQISSAGGPKLALNLQDGTVTSGQFVASIDFYSFGGFVNESIASIQASADGAHASGDKPGRLVFSTTANGQSSPTPRVIINNAGTLYPATDNTYQFGGGAFRWTAIYAVNGTIQTSDARQKTDVSSCSLGSSFIKSLKPVSYKWVEGGNVVTKSKDGKNDVVTTVPGERTHWGFLAQDVKAAVDDAGVDFGGWILTDKDDPNSAQGLRYDQFIAPLTKALQEALTEIDVLKAKVAALESA